MKNKTSIHDIAKSLGVSATTVSFVLNGKAVEKRISQDLESKILKYIEEIGYRPNQVAKSLRTGKSNIIAMLVEDISDPFFSGIARGVEERLYEHGYKIFHSSTTNDTNKTKALIQLFRERQVEGYIIAPAPGTEEDILLLQKENIPVILFDRYFPSLKSNKIIVDNYNGAYKAMMHLIENGYKNIGFVTLKSEQIQMNDRLRGYNEAIVKNDLQGAVLKVAYNSDSLAISENVTGFIKENSQLDAILFATNYLAVNGLVAIKNLGLNIPGDIAIVGFDDNTHFALFSPSVTAVAQPVDQIASEVVAQLLLALNDDDHQYINKTIELETELIIRESSMPNQKDGKLIKNYKGPPGIPKRPKQLTEKSTINKQSKNAV